MEFKDSQQAFNEAVKTGRLSIDPKKDNFAGLYMYMGTDQKDLFKHINTREYLN